MSLHITIFNLFVASCLFLANQLIASSSSTGMEVSVAVDTVGEVRANKDSKATDSLNIRESELTLYGPIDHIFDGILSMAAHKEDGVQRFEVHEGAISSSKLISRTNMRAGQFFLGMGRLNRVHRHDWPFIKAPKVFAKYFGSEGLLDSGIELSYLAPLDYYLDITSGVTNGWTFGHAHDEGKKPLTPTHYGRVGTFFDGGDTMALALGINFLGRTDAFGEKRDHWGLDAVAKGDILGYQYLLQTETWMRHFKPAHGETEETMGTYVFPQINISNTSKVGVLFDYYTILSHKDVSGKKISNSEYSIVPTLTYLSSEFASFKLAYNYSVNSEAGNHSQDHSIQLQTVFILGAHPAHDF